MPSIEKGEGPPMMPPMHTDSVIKKWLDVPYAQLSPTEKLDIYLPNEGQGPFPVIMAIHGGAWAFGNKGDVGQLPMMEGLKRGYAVVCVDYCLSSEAQFPRQIYDVKAAIRFLKAQAETYNLDANRIAAWGASAGAHLTALAGTSSHVKELEDLNMGYAQQKSKLQVVVNWCGPSESFINMDRQLAQNGLGNQDHSFADSPESRLLGQKITEIPDLVKAASPMTYITPDVPYFLIQHGTLDPIVPVQQSIRFAQKLEDIAGKEKVVLEVLEGVGHHGDPAFETSENVDRCLNFIDKHLKSE